MDPTVPLCHRESTQTPQALSHFKTTIMEWQPQPVQPFEECQVEQPGERPGEEESEMPESKAVF